jgi:signal transduction histidine kinase
VKPGPPLTEEVQTRWMHTADATPPVAVGRIGEWRSATGAARVRDTMTRAPFARRTWAETLYALIGLPLGVAGFCFIVVVSILGLALAVTFVGVPLLAFSGLAARRIVGLHRRLARVLLDETIDPPAPFQPARGFFVRVQAALADRAGWRARAYLLLKLPVAVIGFAVAATCWYASAVFLTYPLSHAWFGLNLSLAGGRLDAWPEQVMVVAAGIAVVAASPWLIRAAVCVDRRAMHTLIGPNRRSARVRQLEAARAQVADDAAATLRRIERDLHDGTQAQLVTLALHLGRAKQKLETGDVADAVAGLGLVDAAHRQAKESLLGLRDIARGIHPPALDLGLDAALATLAARSAVPTRLVATLTDPTSAAIESIAYYSAAELLTNVAKHSRARSADLEASTADGVLTLRVTDDGVGGAGFGRGSGLDGLADRVGAVDGEIRLVSPAGGPTVVTIELPLHA